jgi:hypothetical protein
MEAVQNMESCESNPQVVETKKGAFAAVFGQFATREFWKNLFSMIVREALSSFILSLGGTLIYYIKGRANTDSNNIRGITNGMVGNQQQVGSPNAAFSNMMQPQPSYRANYSNNQPVPTQQTYPGFGV